MRRADRRHLSVDTVEFPEIGTSLLSVVSSGHEINLADEIDNAIDLNRVEGRVRESSVRKIGEIIQKHPEEAVTIIRNWLHQQD